MGYADNRKAVEVQCIAALVKYPEIFADIDGLVKDTFFDIPLNKAIFTILKTNILNKEPLDKFTISNKINNLGIKFQNDPYDYLENLELRQVSKDAVVGYFKELTQIVAKKEIDDRLDDIRKYLNNSNNDTFDQVLSKCDSLYGDVVNSFSLDGEPRDVFAEAKDYIEELGNQEGTEIQFPFPLFQKFYGGLEQSTLTLFVAGYKVGKSWFLLNLLKRLCTENNDVEGIYIDTEMSTEEVMRRLIAEKAGINEYYLRHGWRKNKDLCNKVRAVWPEIQKWFGKIQHIYVGNISQEQTESVIRRWVWKKRAEKPNIKPVIIYDYFKLHGGDNIKDAFASSMVLGYKVDSIKKLTQELKVPIVAAAQTNAGGEVGLSREIPKFVDSAYKLRVRSPEEIEEEGGLATHKIETICNRSLGPELKQFNDRVKMGKDRDGKTIWRDNALLYRFNNFKVEELTTLSEHMSMHMLPKKPKNNEGEIF